MSNEALTGLRCQHHALETWRPWPMERSTGDVPRGIANSEENEALAGSLPMFPSLKSHFIGLAEVGYHPSLKAVKQVELADS